MKLIVLIGVISLLLFTACERESVVDMNCYTYCLDNETQVKEANTYQKIAIESQQNFCLNGIECKGVRE